MTEGSAEIGTHELGYNFGNTVELGYNFGNTVVS